MNDLIQNVDEKLGQLRIDRDDIENAIVSKQITLEPGSGLNDFADAINQIPGRDVQLYGVKATNNETFEIEHEQSLEVNEVVEINPTSLREWFAETPSSSPLAANRYSVVINDVKFMIADNAFYDCGRITDIQLPKHIISIGDYAFCKCRSLKSIFIPDTVTSIGHSAFQYCTFLQSINIPDSVKTIGAGAFQNCANLSVIRLPDTIKILGGNTFQGCTKLSDIHLSNSLETIEKYEFASCENLSSITIPATVKSIHPTAFYYDKALTYIAINQPKDSIPGAPWGAPGGEEIVHWTG